MAAETLLKQLKSGKSVRESMAVADVKQAVFDVIAGIEVTKKNTYCTTKRQNKRQP